MIHSPIIFLIVTASTLTFLGSLYREMSCSYSCRSLSTDLLSIFLLGFLNFMSVRIRWLRILGMEGPIVDKILAQIYNLLTQNITKFV